MAIIYRHRRLDTNKIFYIGISNNNRRPYRNDGRNNHWVKVYKKAGRKVEILYNDIPIEDAIELEEFLIELYGRQDLKTGLLVNKTTGGELFKHSDESKEKMRQSKLGDKNPMYGKKQSNKTIKKRNKKLIGLKRDEESINNLKNGAVKSGQSKKTLLIEYATNIILGEFNSLSDACRFAGLDPLKYSGKASIIANNKSSRKQIKGFTFKYKKEWL